MSRIAQPFPCPLPSLQMIAAQVDIPERLFHSLFDPSNQTDEARMFRALCESTHMGKEALRNPEARNTMAGHLLQALDVDRPGSSLVHAGTSIYDLKTPDTANNAERFQQKQQIQNRIDQALHGAVAAPSAAPRAPVGDAPPHTRRPIDALARSTNAQVRQAAGDVQREHDGRMGPSPDGAHSARQRPKGPVTLWSMVKTAVSAFVKGEDVRLAVANKLASSTNDAISFVGDTAQRDLLIKHWQKHGSGPSALQAPEVASAERAAANPNNPYAPPSPQYTERRFSASADGQTGAAADAQPAPRRMASPSL